MRKLALVTLLAILCVVCVFPAAAARDLMPFLEQEAWLAYAAYAPELQSVVVKKLIDIRDDNYAFGDIDPSFAMRNVIAVWRLAAAVTKDPISIADYEKDAALAKTETLSAIEKRILEVLAIEADLMKKQVPAGLQYRMPIMVYGDVTETEITQPLIDLIGEHALSKAAADRWNRRLPIAAVDIKDNVIPPYVLAIGAGTGLSYKEVIVNRALAEALAKRLAIYKNLTGKLTKEEKAMLNQITATNLTETLKSTFEK
jgi:hypothetical protein